MTKKTIIIYTLTALSLFIFSAGLTYWISSSIKPKPTKAPIASPTPTPQRKSKIDPAIPRTEACPLNGVLFTKQEKEAWEKRRPLAVIIENHVDSRPTSGLTNADIVYEGVSEGGVTRFMGIFYCGIAVDNITFAPVRSARIHFTKLVPEYDALYNHVGGAGNCDDPTVDERAKALCFIRRNKIKDLDQFGLDFKACHRVTNRIDKEVAYEHTMACYSDELYKVAEKRKWTNVDEKKVPWNKNFVSWKFKDESKSSTPTATNIGFDFWTSQKDYSVSWRYDAETNSYLRSNKGEKAIDHNTGEQISAKNLVIQLVKETGPVDEHKHMLYEVTGTGKMLLFQDGQAISGTWSKTTPIARTKFFSSDGKEIKFNAGVVWIELVPSKNKIEYN